MLPRDLVIMPCGKKFGEMRRRPQGSGTEAASRSTRQNKGVEMRWLLHVRNDAVLPMSEIVFRR